MFSTSSNWLNGVVAGANDVANATLDGGTARWNQTGPLLIGNAGAGTVNVINGGRLTGSSAVMGVSATGTATVRVDGPASGSQWTNTGSFTIADLGNATLNIAGGGFVGAVTTTIGKSSSSLDHSGDVPGR